MNKLHVNVTQEHIDTGRTGSSSCCMLGTAISKAAGERVNVLSKFSLELDKYTHHRVVVGGCMATLPALAAKLADQWEANNGNEHFLGTVPGGQVKPFNFTLFFNKRNGEQK